MKIELTDDDIRKIIASKLDCNPDDIIFDSGEEYDNFGNREVTVSARVEK